MINFIIFFILIVLIISLALLSKGRYDEYLKYLDNKEYRLKPFLPLALYILDKVNYKYSSKYERSLMKKYSEISGNKYAKYYTKIHIANKIMFLIIGITFIFFIGSVLYLQQIELSSNDMKVKIIGNYGVERPDFGSGDKEIKLAAELQNGKAKVIEEFQIPIKEMPPISEDEKAVSKILEKLTEAIIKGSNKDLMNIYTNLILPPNGRELGDSGVKIVWNSSDENIVKSDGTITQPQYGAGNKKIIIQAILSKGKASYKKNFKTTIIQSEIPISDEQKVLAAGKEIQREIIEGNADKGNSRNYTLPTKINSLSDLKIKWLNKGTEINNGVITLIFGFAFLVIVAFLADNDLNKKIKKRRTRLQLDFPDFLNRFTLLINAGMTVSRAWTKISEDATKGGPLYEEIAQTVLEINSGNAEIIAYENFAERCRISEITKFVSVIEQNIRKGNKELVSVLKFQVNDCWQLRKNIAKRLGEEASTKMLLPLMIMFLAIVLIVATPAVMAMQGF